MMSDTGGHPDQRIVVRVDAELEEIVPKYLENMKKDILSILDALNRSDYEAIRVIGHGMKGTGGGYGFDAITELGAAIEQLAKDGNSEEIRRKADELTAYLGQVEVRYE